MANAATQVIRSKPLSADVRPAARSRSSEYSSSSQRRCRADSGSFKVTGIDILLKSLPMFLHSKFHRFKPAKKRNRVITRHNYSEGAYIPSVSAFGTGSFCLRPISCDMWSSPPSATAVRAEEETLDEPSTAEALDATTAPLATVVFSEGADEAMGPPWGPPPGRAVFEEGSSASSNAWEKK